ncbi:hypothetical protein B0H16DRAFT_1268304, partial [Mycena metata]
SAAIIDLCTPSPAAPSSVQRPKREIKDEVIDLTLSLPHHKPPPERRVPLQSLANSVGPNPDPSLATLDPVRLGSYFASFELGRDTVFAREAELGHIWRIGQTKRGSDSAIRRITPRCNHYGRTDSGHRPDIDPSDYREGRTNRTGCMAHVNPAAVVGGGVYVTVIDFEHYHPREVPIGGDIPRPPTSEQRQLVKQYAATSNFTRTHLSHILASRFSDHILESRQISNLTNACRKEGRDEVDSFGGDFGAV